MKTVMKQAMIGRLLSVVLLVASSASATSRDFVHPGLLHDRADLERMTRLVQDNVYPAVESYQLLKKEPEARFDYRMRGPFDHIARDGQYAHTKAPSEDDCNAAYYNALMWSITHDVRHADKAMEIVRAYTAALKQIHGHDAPLCAGLQGFMLVNAAELMRYTYRKAQYANGWTEEDTRLTERMFREVFLPILTTFVEAAPYANGNWGGSVNKMRMAIGIFTDDEALYNAAVDYHLYSRDNGSLPNYIAESGQLQESGRDQAHCMLGVGVLAELAECAWKQGDDLYGALDNRLMKGYEYLSKVNLGYKDVPFKVWKDATGKYGNWLGMGEAAMGEFRAVFEIAYNHYTVRRGLTMPYTEKVLHRIRPEGAGWTCDNPGFGTLLFYLGNPEPAPRKGEIHEQLCDAWRGWTFATPSLQPEGDGWVLANAGLRMSKRGLMLDAATYPYIEVRFTRYPKGCRDGWLRLSYSVNSAPEYWTFYEKDAVRKEGDTFLFPLKGQRSNNGTLFTDKPVQVTLMLDFGQVERVGLQSITSKKEQ